MTCPHCKRPIPICDADVNGCGTGRAGSVPAPDEQTRGPTWADWLETLYCKGHQA